MAISLSRLQDLLDSNGIVLMQMVLVFYPSFLVSYISRVILLINWVTEKVNHQMTLLQGWIVVVMSKIQKALLLYWQSTMRPSLDLIIEKMRNAWEDLMLYLLSTVRAVRDPIARKMKNLSEALEMYLANDAAMGQPKAKVIGKLSLLSATFLLQDSELRFKYDKTGVITMCFIFICLSLLTFSYYWSKKIKILCRRWGCTTNSTSNFTCFILGIFFEKFYDNSLRNLGAAFCMVVFTLSLLVVLRPPIDFGFFGFIMGVFGSITHSRFGLKYPIWIMACICFMMFGFKAWLDKHWLDFEENLPWLSTHTNTLGTAVIIACFPHTCSCLACRISLSAAVDSESSWSSLFTTYVLLFLYLVGFARWVKKHAPKDDLPPPTRVRLQTRNYFMHYYDLVCYSLMLDFLYSEGVSIANYAGRFLGGL